MDGHGVPGADKGGIDRGLSRSRRVAGSYVFKEAFEQDRCFRGRHMVMWLRTGPDAGMRLGVIAGRKSLSKAVMRSRGKRLLREAFRLNRFRFEGNYDVILLARRPITGASRQEVEEDLLLLAERAGILAKRK